MGPTPPPLSILPTLTSTPSTPSSPLLPPPLPPSSNTLVEGWLQKRRISALSTHASYKRRFFVLNEIKDYSWSSNNSNNNNGDVDEGVVEDSGGGGTSEDGVDVENGVMDGNESGKGKSGNNDKGSGGGVMNTTKSFFLEYCAESNVDNNSGLNNTNNNNSTNDTI